MIRFECDYLEGMHETILQKLQETNREQYPGYGSDPHTEHAKAILKELCGDGHAEVHLLVGGTQTNLTVISSILRPHQGVLCVNTGHVNVHETGAIEATGHKVLALPSEDGKITAAQIQAAYDGHWNDVTHEHMVQPGMVYISQPTENGTTYTKAELEEISKVCRSCGLPLYLDGARLGYALASEGNDLTLKDITALTDVFYIGGTKVGALMGEAVVIANPAFQRDFRYLIKQKGALLAKGRFLGLQFEALFENGLYFEISEHAVGLAMKIRRAFENAGCAMRFDSKTNQQFPIIPDAMLDRLREKYAFDFWEKTDEGHTAVRVCTSWATKEENVESLLADVKMLSGK